MKFRFWNRDADMELAPSGQPITPFVILNVKGRPVTFSAPARPAEPPPPAPKKSTKKKTTKKSAKKATKKTVKKKAAKKKSIPTRKVSIEQIGKPGDGVFYASSPALATLYDHGVTWPRDHDRLAIEHVRNIRPMPDEIEMIDAMREVLTGDHESGLRHLRRAFARADGAFLAGFLAAKCHIYDEAATFLEESGTRARELGKFFAKHKVELCIAMPLGTHVWAHCEPSPRGLAFGLFDVHRRQNRPDKIEESLEQLRKITPKDPVVRLFLVEHWLDHRQEGKDLWRRIVKAVGKVGNETAVHASLLLHKANALRHLGKPDEAREELSLALRRKKDRDPILLLALRWERALAYEAAGDTRQSRKDLESIMADAPNEPAAMEHLRMLESGT